MEFSMTLKALVRRVLQLFLSLSLTAGFVILKNIWQGLRLPAVSSADGRDSRELSRKRASWSRILSRTSKHQNFISFPLFSLTSIVSGKMQAFSRCTRPVLRAAVRKQNYSTGSYAGKSAPITNLDSKLILDCSVSNC